MSKMANTGRRRGSRDNTSTGEDHVLNCIANRAEELLQEKRKDREKARLIRQQEIEKKQREEEEKLRTGSSQQPMIRTDVANISTDIELQAAYKELEEKYRRSIQTNAQLEKEKSALVSEVEDIQEQIDDTEERTCQITEELRRKRKEIETQEQRLAKVTNSVFRLTTMINDRDKVLREHKLLGEADGESGVGSGSEEDQEPITSALLSKGLAEILLLMEGTLEEKILRTLHENSKLKNELSSHRQELSSLRDQVEIEPNDPYIEPRQNGWVSVSVETAKIQQKTTREVNDYKMRIQKADLDITVLESSILRLESQVRRYRELATDSERTEEDLKSDKRRLLREIREAQQQIEELLTHNTHLQNRLERVQKARNQVPCTVEGSELSGMSHLQ